MRFARPALGVVAGIMLGLGVVALAGSGLNPYVVRASPVEPTYSLTNGTSIPNASVMTESTGVRQATPLSLVGNIAHQPIILTGYVLLPIFAALLCGFVLYHLPRRRTEDA